ncbi:hypothetical protein [Nonomuraea jiangxiensis]|uniref:hypothetical protein n=1 Tax=Nonomuraea jiangxiensis TaxID=633440 RepID=UPI00115FEFEC|nr:hypothetical protein [Nonomuraea jiangxiensis]
MNLTGAAGGHFEGLRIGYLPQGVTLWSTYTSQGGERDYRSRTWRADGKSITLTAEWLHGRPLTRWARQSLDLRLESPTPMHGEAAVHRSEDGSALVWKGRHGEGYALTAAGGLGDELDRVFAGLTPDVPGQLGGSPHGPG